MERVDEQGEDVNDDNMNGDMIIANMVFKDEMDLNALESDVDEFSDNCNDNRNNTIEAEKKKNKPYEVQLTSKDLLSLYTEIDDVTNQIKATRSVILNRTISDEEKRLTIIDGLQFTLFLSVDSELPIERLSKYLKNSYGFVHYDDKSRINNTVIESDNNTVITTKQQQQSNESLEKEDNVDVNHQVLVKDEMDLSILDGISNITDEKGDNIKQIEENEDRDDKDIDQVQYWRNAIRFDRKEAYNRYSVERFDEWKKENNKKNPRYQSNNNRSNSEIHQNDIFDEYGRSNLDISYYTDTSSNTYGDNNTNYYNNNNQRKNKKKPERETTPFSVFSDLICIGKGKEMITEEYEDDDGQFVSFMIPKELHYRVTFTNHLILYYFLRKFLRNSTVHISNIPYTIRVLDFEEDTTGLRCLVAKHNAFTTKPQKLHTYIERQLPVFTDSKNSFKYSFDNKTLITHGILHPSSLDDYNTVAGTDNNDAKVDKYVKSNKCYDVLSESYRNCISMNGGGGEGNNTKLTSLRQFSYHNR